MLLPRWVRPAGFGAMSLLVGLSWAQSGTQGRLGGWAIGGGIAALILCAVVDRLRPSALAAAAAVLATGAVCALTGADPSNIGWFVLVVLAGYLALTVPFLPGLVAWLVTVAVVAVLAVIQPDAGWSNWAAGVSVLFWAAWAGRHRIALLERVHRAEANAAAAETVAQRQRLAGELHDIVAHTLAVTVLHLGGARLALAHHPAEAEERIAEAERLARSSMTELRRVIRVLAEDDSAPPGAAEEVPTPQPTAADVPALLAEYRAAGLPLSSRLDGELTVVSGTTGVVLYRLVREALANAARHAPGQPVDVQIRVSPDGAVDVTVSNPCRAPDPADRHRGSRGMGLRAMNDRVRMVGGHFSAGAYDGRWAIRGELPA